MRLCQRRAEGPGEGCIASQPAWEWRAGASAIKRTENRDRTADKVSRNENKV